MYVFLMAFSLLNDLISHTFYLNFFYRSCTPSPKPPTVSKSSHRQALSAVEAYTKLLQEQSMTCFRNSQHTEKAQEKQQDHSPQVSGLLHLNVQDTKCIADNPAKIFNLDYFFNVLVLYDLIAPLYCTVVIHVVRYKHCINTGRSTEGPLFLFAMTCSKTCSSVCVIDAFTW